jgi:hypothetical protein
MPGRYAKGVSGDEAFVRKHTDKESAARYD